jgi:hypothetical protein
MELVPRWASRHGTSHPCKMEGDRRDVAVQDREGGRVYLASPCCVASVPLS